MRERFKNSLERLTRIGADPADSDDIQLKKSLLVLCAFPFAFAGLAWGLMYFILNEPLAGSIPFCYGIISLASIAYFGMTRRYYFFRFSQLTLILLLPFFLMVSLGGFVNGSAVILWGVICPLGALVFDEPRRAKLWLLAYVSLLILSGFLQPHVRFSNNLSQQAQIFFFVMNVSAVGAFLFMMVFYFVKQKDLLIELMQKNRELEQSYLQQEVMLRQSEKLATLGRLSAGMAHELNNPASAAVRGSKQLQHTIEQSEELLVALGQMSLTGQQLKLFEAFKNQIHIYTQKPVELSALARSDREAEIETWLEKRNIDDAWEIASVLVNSNFSKNDLSTLDENFTEEQFPTILSSLRNIHMTHNLLEEIGQGTGRITEIVKSLKSYSYMDKAPLQSVDIHEGLNDTLVMLRSQLKAGVTVHKEFDKTLPRIQAYGSELNQVWTNIVDNAINAMGGEGEITIRTFKKKPWLVVQIEDSGPGIPEQVQAKVFDPFFTTKAPGEGTGLGLNISHNIIVQKHQGQIGVQSGETGACFEIKLPLGNDTI